MSARFLLIPLLGLTTSSNDVVFVTFTLATIAGTIIVAVLCGRILFKIARGEQVSPDSRSNTLHEARIWGLLGVVCLAPVIAVVTIAVVGSDDTILFGNDVVLPVGFVLLLVGLAVCVAALLLWIRARSLSDISESKPVEDIRRREFAPEVSAASWRQVFSSLRSLLQSGPAGVSYVLGVIFVFLTLLGVLVSSSALVDKALIAPMLVGIAIGWSYSVASLRYLSPLGQTDFQGVLGLDGSVPGHEYYTERGWRYRRRGTVFFLTGILVSLTTAFVLAYLGKIQ